MAVSFTDQNLKSNYILRNQVDLLNKTDYYLSLSNYGAVGDGVTDDTAAFNEFLEDCRTTKRIGFVPVPSNYYLVSSTLNISGCHIESTYNTIEGTGLYPFACKIRGDGTFPIFEQQDTDSQYARMCIKNFNLSNGTIGLKVTKSIFTQIEGVFTEFCPIGFQIGDNSVTGPLWVELKRCMAYYCSTAGLIIEGADGNGNAIYCDTCYFRGSGASSYSVIQDVTSSLQGVSNSFFNCEFVNDSGVGIRLVNGKNMQINNGYCECRGPIIKISNNNSRSASVAFNDCLFASLYNSSEPENSTGVSAWIWHANPDSGTSQLSEVSVNGGYVLIGSSTKQADLRLVASDDPDNLIFKMANDPVISGTNGFKLYDTGLPTANFRVNYTDTYTPVWTALGTNPFLGDGILTGEYTLNGELVHCTIQFQAGSTTTFGNGDWRFSLPFVASATEFSIGNVVLRDDSTGKYYTGIVDKQGGDVLQLLLNDNSAAVKFNNPFTWDADDLLSITITYNLVP